MLISELRELVKKISPLRSINPACAIRSGSRGMENAAVYRRLLLILRYRFFQPGEILRCKRARIDVGKRRALKVRFQRPGPCSQNGLAADAISTDRRAVFRRLGRIQLVTANAGDCRNADVPCMRVVIAHRISSLSKMSTSSSTRIIFLARNRSPAPAARPAPAGLHRRVDVFHLQDPEELTATRGVGVDIL